MADSIDAQIAAAEAKLLDKQIADAEAKLGGSTSEESGLSKLGRYLNVLPGMGRATAKYALAPVGDAVVRAMRPDLANGVGTSESITEQYVKDLELAKQGKMPSSSEMYNVPFAVGLGLDMIQDPTSALLGAGGKALQMGGVPAINALRRAISLSPEAAQSLPRAITPGVGEKVAAALRGSVAGVGKMLSASDYVDKVAAPLKTLLQKGSRQLYRSALPELDQAVTTAGLEAPSQVLLRRGIFGTNKGIAKGLTGEVDALDAAADDIASKAGAHPGSPGVDNAAAIAEARAKSLAGVANDSPYDSARAALEPHLVSYEQAGTVSMPRSLNTTAKLKPLAQSAYREGDSAASSALEPQVWRDVRTAMRKQQQKAIAAIPDGGPKAAELFGQANNDMGSLIGAQEAAKQAAKKPLFTPGDLLIGLGGMAAPAGAPAGLKLLLAKRLAQGAASTGVKTSIGQSAQVLSQVPFVDELARQGLIQSQSPWTLMPPEKK